MKKTCYSSQFASPDDPTGETSALAEGLSGKDLNFLIAVAAEDTIKNAAVSVGLDYTTATRKYKKLKPVLDRIYPILQQEATKRLTLLAPKAANALGELLDDLHNSKTDTKRKTAEAILDRVTGKPIARVAVKRQADEEVKVTFTGWNPPVVKLPDS